MSNMSYCRFQNTLQDLLDCQDAIFDDDLSTEERKARRQLIEVCKEIAKDFAEDDLNEND